jgi:hypothetical protein
MNGTFWLLGAVLPALACAAIPEDAASNHDCVVLLHGLGRTTISMKRLEWSLARRGYQVVNLSHPSTRLPVERLAREHLAPAVQRIEVRPGAHIHFVTHSLGGIVLRQYLSENSLMNLGRVVMLGPPNQGSEVADRLKGNPFYKWSTGPAGQQLGTRPEDLPRRLGPANWPLGVIAGDRSFNPLFSRLLPGPADGKVSVASTQVEGMSDFVVMHASHTWLMWRRPILDQVFSFLETGRFRDGETASLH